MKKNILMMAVFAAFLSFSVVKIGDGVTVAVPAVEAKAEAKVTICHIPPGNPSNTQTLSVGESAVAAHLAEHGDYLGACGSAVTNDNDNASNSNDNASNNNDNESKDNDNESKDNDSESKDNDNESKDNDNESSGGGSLSSCDCPPGIPSCVCPDGAAGNPITATPLSNANVQSLRSIHGE
ncbi:hypothetical protein Ga0123461_0522 [Mariprofundus aestuarium]|uniref:Secreted protein n=1 Tax=Mariprofundus aestuarium TaxID=1921086 RepID=A0A2K8KYI9_MARES|nr:hypothetical protein [Mariprofundus aestuarium]ATX78959.1 hypothetical protein Ga0123461_0522 [Mariprofundus aestuarium]